MDSKKSYKQDARCNLERIKNMTEFGEHWHNLLSCRQIMDSGIPQFFTPQRRYFKTLNNKSSKI